MERWSLKLVREAVASEFVPVYDKAGGPRDVARIARYFLKDEPVEVMLAFYLNSQNVVVGWQEVSRGLVDAALVHPREIYKAAILANASGVIIVHNHPSGNATPSYEDRKISESLKKAGEIVGIRLLDHLVVTLDDWESAM
jgi:DNA repair protein RadC